MQQVAAHSDLSPSMARTLGSGLMLCCSVHVFFYFLLLFLFVSFFFSIIEVDRITFRFSSSRRMEMHHSTKMNVDIDLLCQSIRHFTHKGRMKWKPSDSEYFWLNGSRNRYRTVIQTTYCTDLLKCYSTCRAYIFTEQYAT